MYVKKYTFRFLAVFIVFFCSLTFFFIKLLFIQCRSDHLRRLAEKQHDYFLELEAKRGRIYDRNERPLALNLPSQSLYAVPSEVSNKRETAQKLASILEVDEEFLLSPTFPAEYEIRIIREDKNET